MRYDEPRLVWTSLTTTQKGISVLQLVRQGETPREHQISKFSEI
jgi:hypothetical protein